MLLTGGKLDRNLEFLCQDAGSADSMGISRLEQTRGGPGYPCGRGSVSVKGSVSVPAVCTHRPSLGFEDNWAGV